MRQVRCIYKVGKLTSFITEFRILILALEFTVLFDKLKKAYNHFNATQHTLTMKEKQQQLKEIGVLSAKVTQVSVRISKTVLKTQLNTLIDKSIAWASREKAKSLVSNSESKTSITKLRDKIKHKVLSEFSWFPHSRL